MIETENVNTKTPETFQSIWTKRLFLASVVILGIVLTLQGVGILPSPEAEPKPFVGKPLSAGGLRCDSPIWDFGSVDSVKTLRLSNEFVLTNESNEIVTIEKVHSTCGCMVAEDYDKEIAPGKSTKLRVDVTLPTIPQTFSKSLAVQVKGGVVPLKVVGEILANGSLYCVPATINFGVIRQGETKEKEVKILRYDLSPILFQTISTSINGITHNQPNNSNSRSITLKFMLQDSLDISRGYSQSFIVVKTQNKSFPELKIPVVIRKED